MKPTKTAIVIFALFVTGGILLTVLFRYERRKEQSASQAVNRAESVQESPQAALSSQAEFERYNKVLPESKITGVKDIEGPYKKVTIHDGQITFSFEVPDTYFVETRNSGEREMTEEELREFFATNYFGNIKENPELSGQYLDFNWEMLKNMKYEEMKKVFDEYINPGNFPGFPKASLSSLGGISYPTASSTQIDLFILPTINFRFTLKKTIGGRSAFISFGENTPDPYSKWMEVNIPLAKEKSLVLYKQHYVRPEERAQYTQDDLKKIESESFDHLLDSLRFE